MKAGTKTATGPLATRASGGSASSGSFRRDFEPYPAAGLADWASLTEAERAYETRRMQIYAAMVGIMDEQIGRVLGYLDEQGIADDTLVLFMSDNGADGTATGAGFDEADDNRLENLGSATSYVTVGANWARVSSTPLRLYKNLYHRRRHPRPCDPAVARARGGGADRPELLPGHRPHAHVSGTGPA